MCKDVIEHCKDDRFVGIINKTLGTFAQMLWLPRHTSKVNTADTTRCEKNVTPIQRSS